MSSPHIGNVHGKCMKVIPLCQDGTCKFFFFLFKFLFFIRFCDEHPVFRDEEIRIFVFSFPVCQRTLSLGWPRTLPQPRIFATPSPVRGLRFSICPSWKRHLRHHCQKRSPATSAMPRAERKDKSMWIVIILSQTSDHNTLNAFYLHLKVSELTQSHSSHKRRLLSHMHQLS